jgi:hypothetical protein
MRHALHQGTQAFIDRIAACIEGRAEASLHTVLDPQATATMLYQQWLGASLLSRLSRDRASDGSRHAGHATRAGAATVAPFVLAPYVHPERTSHEQHPQTNRRIVLASRPLRPPPRTSAWRSRHPRTAGRADAAAVNGCPWIPTCAAAQAICLLLRRR